MSQSPALFSATLTRVVILLAVLATVWSQQATWRPQSLNRVQFSPLPLMYQNFQGAVAQATRPQALLGQPLAQALGGQSSGASPLRTLSSLPPLGGKLRLLSTLFGGLRNSGLERTIAGEILQRLIKTGLKDLLVPFKRDVFSPLLS